MGTMVPILFVRIRDHLQHGQHFRCRIEPLPERTTRDPIWCERGMPGRFIRPTTLDNTNDLGMRNLPQPPSHCRGTEQSTRALLALFYA